MSADEATSVYVDRFYEMDPVFDDLVQGPDLADGNVVLIEDRLMRGDVDRAHADDISAKYEMARIRVNNRWCTVSDLSFDGELVRFVALYADGTKAPRTFHRHFYWLVKQASVVTR